MPTKTIYTDAIVFSDGLVSIANGLSGDQRRHVKLSALVMSLAAIDKILHQSVLNKFTVLMREEDLDDLVKFKISDAYDIAIDARVRKGKGGKKKSRPGNKIKLKVVEEIYKDCYLAKNNLEKIAKLTGLAGKNIWDEFKRAKARPEGRDDLIKMWNHAYSLRNKVVHECMIKRQARQHATNFLIVTEIETDEYINYLKQFGEFLSENIG